MHLMGGTGPLLPPLVLPLVLPLTLVLVLLPLVLPLVLVLVPLELPVELPLASDTLLAEAAASARIELVPRHDGQRQSLLVSSSERIDLRDDCVTSDDDDDEEEEEEEEEDIGFIGIAVADDAAGRRMPGGGELLGARALAGAV